MRRFLSIAICSVIASSSAFGAWSWGVSLATPRASGTYVFKRDGVQAGSGSFGTSTTGFSSGNNADSVQVVTVTLTYAGGRVLNLSFSNPGAGQSRGATVNQVSNNATYDNGSIAWFDGYEPPPDEDTLVFSKQFGGEYSGVTITITDAEGNPLGEWVIPNGGTLLEADITGPAGSLEGNIVYMDGVPFGTVADGTIVTLGGGVDRPGYSLAFDETYTGGEWQIRRQDGSIAGSGPAGTLNNLLEGRVTVADGQGAEIWTRVPAGDGMGSVWIPTGVTLQGNETTPYTFINNPSHPGPTPMPTPEPVTSPTPGPTPPTTTTNTTPVVTNPTNSEDYVTVDVGSLELEDADDGEGNVITAIGELQTLMQGIVSDMAQTQQNFMDAGDELNGLRLGGVGSKCTFQFGPAQIQLQTSGPLRTGLTLMVIGMAGFVAAGMLRNAVQ